LLRLPDLTLPEPTLVRNPALLDEPNTRNPVRYAPTRALNNATPRARAA